MTILLLMTQGIKKFQRYLRKSVMGRPYVNIVCTCNGNVCVCRSGLQRARPAQRGAARGASAPGRPRPRSSARTRCAPPASCPYLARKDPRKSPARPLRSMPQFASCLQSFVFVCAPRCCSRLLHSLPLSMCSSCQSMIPNLLVCFTYSLFCSARTSLLSHRHCTLSFM